KALPQLDISLAPQIEADVLSRDLADAARGLWRTFKRVSRDFYLHGRPLFHREFQLSDSTIYYFNSIDRMVAPQY
ncbi:hypothetical protein C8F04DRAFT_980465, partial [Mycena alexandri]